MSRGETRHLEEYFGARLGVTHGTYSTTISLPGPLQVLAIQLDTLTAPSATTFHLTIDGNKVKSGALAAGAATRDIAWVGRSYGVANQVVLGRATPAETHFVFWTMIYRRDA